MLDKKVANLNDAEFDINIADGVTLVDFWAPWCGPCRMQTPILEELVASVDGRAKIAKVNVDEASGVAGSFGIQAIPTLILFRDGKEVRRFTGVQSKDVLMDAIGSTS